MMFKINTPRPPRPLALPTDPMAAWANGYRICAQAMEEAIQDALPRMDVRAKTALVNSLNRFIGRSEGEATCRADRGPRLKLACGHPMKYIEYMDEHGKLICTVCGTTGAMRA